MSKPSTSSGPETGTKRRLTETDIDPSSELTSSQTGETEDAGAGSRADNQPAENRENLTRSEDSHDSGNRDSENTPKAGHGE
ncbi:MAG TPA: hypothetical protein VIM00_10960 [Candidatus Acidoferrum sp.]|jgi:hypothetical protein